jgi:hypothetical protein
MLRWLAGLLLVAPCAPAPGEIIDRIAVSVGNQVITESQIDEEIRVTAFLNHEKLDLSLPARRKAAGRLIEQALVRREMDLSRYPEPVPAEADMLFQSLRAMYPTAEQYQKDLQAYGVAEDSLKRHMLWQLTLLRFVDFRFRPGIQVSDSDVQAYYQEQLAQWQKKGVQPIPSLEDERDQIDEILTQQRIDQALDRWMTDTRTQVAISYRDQALRDGLLGDEARP